MNKEQIHDIFTGMCDQVTEHYMAVSENMSAGKHRNILQQYSCEMESVLHITKQMLIDHGHIEEEPSSFDGAIVICSHCGEQMESFNFAGHPYYKDRNGHYPGQQFYVTPDGKETRTRGRDRKKVTIIGNIIRRNHEEQRITRQIA